MALSFLRLLPNHKAALRAASGENLFGDLVINPALLVRETCVPVWGFTTKHVSCTIIFWTYSSITRRYVPTKCSSQRVCGWIGIPTDFDRVRCFRFSCLDDCQFLLRQHISTSPQWHLHKTSVNSSSWESTEHLAKCRDSQVERITTGETARF